MTIRINTTIKNMMITMMLIMMLKGESDEHPTCHTLVALSGLPQSEPPPLDLRKSGERPEEVGDDQHYHPDWSVFMIF